MKKIFLVGNPNVGKTSLFNILTDSCAETANFSGTTIEAHSGITRDTQNEKSPHFKVIDLAGVYSFDGKKEENSLVWKNIEAAMADENAIFLQVINVGQWRQSLHLTLDLQKKGIKPILFFNTKKFDKNLGERFYKTLEKEFLLPVFWGDVEEKNFTHYFWDKFFAAVKSNNSSQIPKTFSSASEKNHYLAEIFTNHADTENGRSETINRWRKLLDTVFLHSVFGVGVFFIFLYLLFQVTFTLGAIPMEWIDQGTSLLQEGLQGWLGEGMLSSFLIDGIVAGVGGTAIFLPNIMILFFFLSLLKESGYLARTSFLIDIIFQKLGISGRASIPLLMGFGCNVPSIMMIKTFTTKKEQIIVAMMTLFMSCGAKLPVYTLLISAFVPASLQAVSLFSIYILGILVSLMTGKMLNIACKRKTKNSLKVFELPQLALPNLLKALSYSLQKGKYFLLKVGEFIVPLSAILWILFTFPADSVKEFGIEKSYGASVGKIIQPVFSPLGFDWKISTALLSGLAAKELMVTTFAQLYQAQDETGSLQANIKNSGDFSLSTALSLLVFVLLYTPCLAVIGVIRRELGNWWAGFAIVYPTLVAWVLALLTFWTTNFFT